MVAFATSIAAWRIALDKTNQSAPDMLRNDPSWLHDNSIIIIMAKFWIMCMHPVKNLCFQSCKRTLGVSV